MLCTYLYTTVFVLIADQPGLYIQLFDGETVPKSKARISWRPSIEDRKAVCSSDIMDGQFVVLYDVDRTTETNQLLVLYSSFF